MSDKLMVSPEALPWSSDFTLTEEGCLLFPNGPIWMGSQAVLKEQPGSAEEVVGLKIKFRVRGKTLLTRTVTPTLTSHPSPLTLHLSPFTLPTHPRPRPRPRPRPHPPPSTPHPPPFTLTLAYCLSPFTSPHLPSILTLLRSLRTPRDSSMSTWLRTVPMRAARRMSCRRSGALT